MGRFSWWSSRYQREAEQKKALGDFVDELARVVPRYEQLVRSLELVDWRSSLREDAELARAVAADRQFEVRLTRALLRMEDEEWPLEDEMPRLLVRARRARQRLLVLVTERLGENSHVNLGAELTALLELAGPAPVEVSAPPPPVQQAAVPVQPEVVVAAAEAPSSADDVVVQPARAREGFLAVDPPYWYGPA